jgi:hypothetical protein
MSFQDVLDACNENSARQLRVLREVAEKVIGERRDLIAGVNGSLARGELTSGSDVDFFLLTTAASDDAAIQTQAAFRAAFEAVGIKMPAEGGVFATPLPVAELVHNIGGFPDTNEFITRRMLFLLEGEWIANRSGFEEIRNRLVNRYVEEDLDERKICLFLLNDIIRYWRTICVDYEHKVHQGNKAKAIRLIKLRFSRMMLYFGGILAVEGTEGLSYEKKREALLSKLSLTPIQRMQQRFGSKAEPALVLYGDFLAAIDDPKVRAALDQPAIAGLSTSEFTDLSEKARQFREELAKLLLVELGASNPVVRAALL